MKGTTKIEAADVAAARSALGRAIASGALGAGVAVRVDGEELVLAGGVRGRVRVRDDGVVVWDAALPAGERLRVAEAVLVATLTSLAATLAFSALAHVALSIGSAVGVAWATGRIAGDRARLRRRIGALVNSLPLLLDA